MKFATQNSPLLNSKESIIQMFNIQIPSVVLIEFECCKNVITNFSSSVECKKGFECTDGQCRFKPECKYDRDCNDGEECKNSICIPGKPKPPKSQCTKNLDCPENDVCKKGKCVKGKIGSHL